MRIAILIIRGDNEMKWRLLLAAVAIAALVLMSGCDDEGDDGTESTTPTEVPEATATTAPDVTSTPEPGASPGSESTGIPELDAIVDALRSGDPEALRPLVRFSERPCGFDLGVPSCLAGEPEGTVVEAFVVGRCEGEFFRPDETERVLGFLTPQRLYALYRMTPDALGDPNAEYAAITSVDSGGSQTAWVMWIAGGRIVGTSMSCGPVPPEQFVQALGLTEVVLPPAQE